MMNGGGDMTGGIIGGITSMLGQVAQGVGAAKANKWAKERMYDQMKWAEKMRASAYQTAVRDLGSAGLNPVLAVGGGPGLAGAPSVPAPQTRNVAEGMASSAAGLVPGMLASAKQGAALRDQLRTIAAQASQAETSADIASNTQATREKQMELDLRRTLSEVRLLDAQAEQSGAHKLSLDVNRYLGEAELPGARAKMHFDETRPGQFLREVRRVLDSLTGARGGIR